jgi:hypothetical protein
VHRIAFVEGQPAVEHPDDLPLEGHAVPVIPKADAGRAVVGRDRVPRGSER